MTKKLQYRIPNKLDVLHDELRAAGFRPEMVSGSGDDIVLMMPDGVDEAAIGAIVAAHDPTKPTATALDDTDRAEIAAKLRAGLDGWATLTAAQKDALLRLCVRGVLRLAR